MPGAVFDAFKSFVCVGRGSAYQSCRIDDRKKWVNTEGDRRDAISRGRPLGTESLYHEREYWKALFWELQERLLDTTATTPRGVLAKMRGFYHDDEIAGLMAGEKPDDLPADYAASIYRDLERLAGEVRS